MNILIINGPNLSLLGQREPDIYGNKTLQDMNQQIQTKADAMGMHVLFFQSDCEGDIITRIGQTLNDNIDGIIINPAAYTHTSYGIRDALAAVPIPAIEVHLTNIYKREEFRKVSLTAPAAYGVISGFGACSYILALEALRQILLKNNG